MLLLWLENKKMFCILTFYRKNEKMLDFLFAFAYNEEAIR